MDDEHAHWSGQWLWRQPPWLYLFTVADFQSAACLPKPRRRQVSPICNRPGMGQSQDSGFCRRSAGYKPAIQQTTSLRYERGRHGKRIPLAGVEDGTLPPGMTARNAELTAKPTR